MMSSEFRFQVRELRVTRAVLNPRARHVGLVVVDPGSVGGVKVPGVKIEGGATGGSCIINMGA